VLDCLVKRCCPARQQPEGVLRRRGRLGAVHHEGQTAASRQFHRLVHQVEVADCGVVELLSAGVVVANVERWHGASPDSFMVHLAIWKPPADRQPERNGASTSATTSSTASQGGDGGSRESGSS
jgi:hypothetical protein